MLPGPSFLSVTVNPASLPGPTLSRMATAFEPVQPGVDALTVPTPRRSRAMALAVKTVASRPRRLRITFRKPPGRAGPTMLAAGTTGCRVWTNVGSGSVAGLTLQGQGARQGP